jgi:hypothetical protein
MSNVLGVITCDVPQVRTHHAKGNGRVMEPQILDCSAVFDPEECIDAGWKIHKEDKRLIHLPRVNFSEVDYTSHLKSLERSISGGMKRSRIKRDPKSRIPLGVRHFWALLQDYNERRDESVLEYLRLQHKKHITCVDFFGTILWDPENLHRIAYLWYDDDHWKHDYRYMSRDSWHRRCKSAMLPERFLQSGLSL